MTQKEFDEIVKDLTELRKLKNQDYGNGFIMQYNKYGKKALFFDMLRKWQRLETLLLSDKEIKVKDETLEDTLGDLAVMAINGIVWMKKNGHDSK